LFLISKTLEKLHMPMEYMNDEARMKAQPNPVMSAFANAGAYLDTRSDLVKQIENLEHDAEALGRVRATIAVNFSPERATDGIVIEKHPSVLHMLIAVIESYRKKLSGHEKQALHLAGAIMLLKQARNGIDVDTEIFEKINRFLKEELAVE